MTDYKDEFRKIGRRLALAKALHDSNVQLEPQLSDGQIFDQGRAHCKQGGKFYECPYAPGTNAERIWLAGFLTEIDEQYTKKQEEK